MEHIKYLIIGAGLSGLSFAKNVKKDFIILEKENEIGGYCRTIRKKNFIWDYAGHFFHFMNPEIKEQFINNINENEIIYKDKCTRIIYKKRLIDYPFQTNIHQLSKKEFVDCLFDLFFKEEKEKYENFLDMLYGKFGKSIVEKFLKPYNEKLYACDLKYLDEDSMGRFFPYADINAIIKNMKYSNDGSYNNTFLYPKNGAGSFIKSFFKELNHDNIFLNSEVVNVDSNKKIVVTKSGKKIHYEYLINTSPLCDFLKILDNYKYESLKNKLSYNKVLVFNLGFNKKSKFDKEHWVYIPDKKINFYRVGFYDNILNSDKSSLYIELGFSKDKNIDVERELSRTLDNLKILKIIDDDMILEEYASIIMNPAYVHINGKTELEIKDFKSDFGKKNIYTIGRYGGWTYCSMEDCMVKAKQLAEELNEAKQ